MFCPHCGSEAEGPLHPECAEQLRRYIEHFKDSENRWTILQVERAERLVGKYDKWNGRGK